MIYESDVSDDDLVCAYRRSALQFIPFKEATGNNSLNEGLACGCPVVTNVSVNLPDSGFFCKKAPLDCEQFLVAIEPWIGEVYIDREKRIASAQAATISMKWETIGEETMRVFSEAIAYNKNKNV